MEHLAFIDREQTLARERRRSHVGSASIHLDSLDYQQGADDDNVKRLAALLRVSRCDRADTRNHAIATIDQDSLDAALIKSGLTIEKLAANTAGEYPELHLPPDLRLQCLHGVDRLAAARRVLRPGDQRWVVDLYLTGDVSQLSSFVSHVLIRLQILVQI